MQTELETNRILNQVKSFRIPITKKNYDDDQIISMSIYYYYFWKKMHFFNLKTEIEIQNYFWTFHTNKKGFHICKKI